MDEIRKAIDKANVIIGEWEIKRMQAYIDMQEARNENLINKFQKDMKNAALNKMLIMFYRDGLEYALKLIEKEQTLS
jgi:hypothetical protein